VKNFWKSVKVWRSYSHEFGVSIFMGHDVGMNNRFECTVYRFDSPSSFHTRCFQHLGTSIVRHYKYMNAHFSFNLNFVTNVSVKQALCVMLSKILKQPTKTWKHVLTHLDFHQDIWKYWRKRTSCITCWCPRFDPPGLSSSSGVTGERRWQQSWPETMFQTIISPS